MLQAQLKAVPFFSGLSKRELDAVAREVDELDFPAGRELIRQGEFGHEFFVIVEGTAAVLQDGAEIAEMSPGDFFGELALLDAAPRTATVEAESEVLTMRLGRTAFQKVLDSEPKVALAMLRTLAARMRESAPSAVD